MPNRFNKEVNMTKKSINQYNRKKKKILACKNQMVKTIFKSQALLLCTVLSFMRHLPPLSLIIMALPTVSHRSEH